MHLIHTNQRPAYMAEMVELAATSSSRSGLRFASHLLYRKLALKTKFGERAFSHELCLDYSCCLEQSTRLYLVLSQTLNISRNFSKLSCLRLHFLFSFIVIVKISSSEMHGKNCNPHFSETARPRAKRTKSLNTTNRPHHTAVTTNKLVNVFQLCKATAFDSRYNHPWRQQSGSCFSALFPMCSTFFLGFPIV